MNYELEEELDDSNEKLGVAESRLRRCRGERDRLTARVRELEGVLENIASHLKTLSGSMVEYSVTYEIARKALEEKP